MVIIAGCEVIAKLHESSRSLVYRGRRSIDQQPVILKTMQAEYPSLEELGRYQLEHDILNHLQLEGVIKSYGLKKHQNGLVLLLEDFGGESLRTLTRQRSLELSEFLEAAIALTDSLGQIHAENVIHKDINPSNIVLNPISKQIKLVDFDNATVLSRENSTIRSPNILEGTLAYLSPEQTGRMNRALDYRTDFYSLGATFYELLTGLPPFQGTDPMELIHCHLAKQPEPPHQVQPSIPLPLSQLILKLLAKNAEDRYQSAYGIKTDLQLCLDQLRLRGAIAAFPLAQQDTSGRFQIPQKLYGREAEVAALLAAFERVTAEATSSARSELMLVAGYSGIGKSALVQEIYKSITRKNGYFITGKFEQLQRNIPYFALIQAFQELMRQILTESPEQIQQWRSDLLTALGKNGQVISEVIPEVELIIGKQPAAPTLPPAETRNRFNLVLQKFIKVFTRPTHPLVIFLDDLQWADSASLKLIQLLMTAPESQFLFLVGAYRSNEVSAAHPLMVTLEEIRKAGSPLNQITLAPLGLTTLQQVMAETFNCDLAQVQPLAELVLQITDGNPFFMNEFLKSIYAEGLFNLDAQTGRWSWDLNLIRAARIPENIVDLMAGKIQKLSPDTQQILKLAACIGSQFDSKTLAITTRRPASAVTIDLWSGIQAGLIIPLSDNYQLANIQSQSLNLSQQRSEDLSQELEDLSGSLIISFKFLHDRVQQAAYSLIPDTEKNTLHYTIGKLLLLHTTANEQEEKIFDIVNQLNRGISLIADPDERHQLVRLNLAAGKKAKESTATEAATRYFLTGIGLLDANCWETQYALTLKLHEEGAEAAYLSGDFGENERLVERILQHAKTTLDRVKAYQVKANAYTVQNNMEAAVDTLVGAMRRLNEPIPRRPSRLRVGLELLRTRFWTIGNRSIAQLEALPLMTDPDKLAAVSLASAGAISSVNIQPLFTALVALRVVNLSVRYGSSPATSVQGIAYGVMLRAGLDDIEGGYEFGRLSLRMMDRLNERLNRILNIVAFESCLRHWKEPLRVSQANLLAAYFEGLELGNQEYATLAISVHCFNRIFMGEPLSEVTAAYQQYVLLIRRMKQDLVVYSMQPWHQLTLNLQDQAIDPTRLSGSAFDEAELLPQFNANQFGIPLFYTYIAKAIWLYHAGDYAGSLQATHLAKPYQESAPCTTPYANRYFYASLACLALCTTASSTTRRRYLRQVIRNQRKAKRWAKYCPDNYQHRYDLVEAERLRVLQRDREAMIYYDRAIQGANAQEQINEAALANELAAKFHLSRAQTKLAQPYLLNARYAYLRWGATFKVKALDVNYSELLEAGSERSNPASLTAQSTAQATAPTLRVSTGSSPELSLDLNTVIKAAQAISSEIVLDKLLEKLLRLTLENAGAQQGCLLLSNQGELEIAAEGRADTNTPILLQSRSLITSQSLPLSLINYVQRTREDLVLRDATQEGRFTTDPYIVQAKPRSILCSPILNQGNLIGILYLENNLATDAFTPDRLTVLNILSAQSAIALENAMFYRTLEQKVEERTAQLAQANQSITLLNEQLKSENLRMGAELAITRQIQQMILPKAQELNQIEQLDIAGFMEPAEEVGGDYYDVLYQNGVVKIGIGDITGHGLESGVLMLMVQTAVRTLFAAQETDPTRFLSTLNRVIYDNIQRMNSTRNLSLILLDYEGDRLRFSGQHEDFLILRADGSIEQFDTDSLGFPIGLIEDISSFVRQIEVQLQPGDGVVLYTDGITEAANLSSELYGLERLCQVVSQHWQRSVDEIRQQVIADVRRHIGGQKIYDDITLLIIKRKG
jgi:predicted ATPase/serine phosphatase RsbU (regulator of sigma subunit)/tRNA A-37 threonylcarbamoyl transferase component Bud32